MNSDKITLETIVIARNDLISSDLSEDELVMLDIDKGSYYGMEDVAKAIWGQLSTPRCVADICATVVEQFDTDIAMAEKDTIDFLSELLKDNLISIHDA